MQKEGGGEGGGIERCVCAVSAACRPTTPMSNLLAGWYYCAYEPCDVGSEAYEAMDEAEREADSEYEQQAGRCTSAAFTAALDTLVQKLGVLEEHLERHAYCCGERMGVDDVMRFVVLQILFTNLGELWGMTAPAMLGFLTLRGGWEIWLRRTATPSSTCMTARCTTAHIATGGSRRCRSACFPRWSRK